MKESGAPPIKQYAFESGGSLTFKYGRDGIVANALGHLFAIPTRLILGTPRDIFKNAPKELMEELYERYKDVPWKGDVLVRIGYDSIIEDFKRLFGQGIKGRPNAFLRVLAIPDTLFTALVAKLNKADHYNPLTHTVTIYHPKLPVGMHELGHAEFWDQEKHPDLWTGAMIASAYLDKYSLFKPGKTATDRRIRKLAGSLPGFRFYTEWKASQNAMKHFRDSGERTEAMKLLEPAFGSYVGYEIGSLANILGSEQNEFLDRLLSKYEPIMLSSLTGVGVGHAFARIPKDRQTSFGVPLKQTEVYYGSGKASA